MNDDKIEVTLRTSNKTGILASVMMQSIRFGLMVSRNRSEKIDDNNSRLFLMFNGTLNCSKNEFIHMMESLPEVHTVENIYLHYSTSPIFDSNKPALNSNSSASSAQLTPLRAIDIITPESLKIAEEKLVDSLGPVASILIESAVTETKHIGDLFLLLSRELEGEEKSNFLGLVSDLNLDE